MLPMQHPQFLDETNSRILSHTRPIYNITSKNVIPISQYKTSVDQVASEVLDSQLKENAGKYLKYFDFEQVQKDLDPALQKKPPVQQFDDSLQQQFLATGIIGLSNAGKSSLINKLQGKYISAVSRLYSTTTFMKNDPYDTELTYGVQTVGGKQLKLMDSPGVIDTSFLTHGWQKIFDTCGMILFVIDGRKKFCPLVRKALNRMQQVQEQTVEIDGQLQSRYIKKVLVVNKMDEVTKKRQLRWLVSEIEDVAKFDKIFYISCITDYNIQELKEYLFNNMNNEPWQQNQSEETNISQIDLYCEFMKQALYNNTYKEVPYRSQIEVAEIFERSDNTFKIKYNVIVDSDHKSKMIVGKNGRQLKKLLSEVKYNLVNEFKKEFQVNINVITRPKIKKSVFIGQSVVGPEEAQKEVVKKLYLGEEQNIKAKKNMLDRIQ